MNWFCRDCLDYRDACYNRGDFRRCLFRGGWSYRWGKDILGWMVHPGKTEQSIRIANNDATDNDRFHDLILKKGQRKPYRLLKNSDYKSVSEKYFTVIRSRKSLCFSPRIR